MGSTAVVALLVGAFDFEGRRTLVGGGDDGSSMFLSGIVCGNDGRFSMICGLFRGARPTRGRKLKASQFSVSSSSSSSRDTFVSRGTQRPPNSRCDRGFMFWTKETTEQLDGSLSARPLARHRNTEGTKPTDDLSLPRSVKESECQCTCWTRILLRTPTL